jgi:ABC-type oligopeptide transport system ATPase subunit
MSPLLQVEHLVKEFPVSGQGLRRQTLRAVDDVSFSVSPGETVAVVGESGSGKSTSARLAVRLLDVTSGTVSFAGDDITGLTGRRLNRFRGDVQVVFQDSSLNPKHTVHDIITAPLRYQGRAPKGGSRALVGNLLERVGLDPAAMDRYPSQFSGGQAQRIGIARALAVDPQILVCDEAVSALDVSVQAQVLKLLADLQLERGLGFLFIAHDLAVVRQIADTVLVMQHGRVVERGSRDEVFHSPRHDYTKTLLDAVPRINPEWEARRRAGQAERDARQVEPEQTSRERMSG